MKTFIKLSLCTALIFGVSSSMAANVPLTPLTKTQGGACTVNARAVDRALLSRDFRNLRPALDGPITCTLFEFKVEDPNHHDSVEFSSVAALYKAGFRITQVHVVPMDTNAGAFTQLIVEKR